MLTAGIRFAQVAFAMGMPSWVWEKLRFDMNAKIRKIALKKKQQ